MYKTIFKDIKKSVGVWVLVKTAVTGKYYSCIRISIKVYNEMLIITFCFYINAKENILRVGGYSFIIYYLSYFKDNFNNINFFTFITFLDLTDEIWGKNFLKIKTRTLTRKRRKYLNN